MFSANVWIIFSQINIHQYYICMTAIIEMASFGGEMVSVHMHDLVSVCLLCNIGKTETFMLFCMHCDYLIGFIWGKMGFRRASIIKRKLMRFSGSNLSMFTCMIWLVFVCYATKN